MGTLGPMLFQKSHLSPRFISQVYAFARVKLFLSPGPVNCVSGTPRFVLTTGTPPVSLRFSIAGLTSVHRGQAEAGFG